MKVRFDKNDKKYFTMAEAPIVNAIIKDMKSSDDTLESAVEYAMHALDVYETLEVLKVDAKIYHNHNAWNYFNEESGTIDIWVEATVGTFNVFYRIGFYLSDAWSVGSDNHNEIANRMYVEKFIEVNK